MEILKFKFFKIFEEKGEIFEKNSDYFFISIFKEFGIKFLNFLFFLIPAICNMLYLIYIEVDISMFLKGGFHLYLKFYPPITQKILVTKNL